MKPFVGIADDNVEKAIRRGYTVPEGAVNLAWAKAPKISPKNNTVIIDTSRIVAENQITDTRRKRLAYANAVGILEDENGNQVWEEEYPIISDKFSVDKDFTDESIFPYVHVSRYFHLDFAGLAMPGNLFEYRHQEIKIIDVNGNDFIDSDGNKRYRIYLYAAPTTGDDAQDVDNAYRAYAFFDAEPSDELYFTYNKIEIDVDGYKVRNQLGYREIINSRPYFKYLPEESDVIDHSSLKKKVYSTKPVTLKEKILGLPTSHVEGWKIFVPKKAINDTRIFQLFRWRLGCEFIQTVEVDPSRDAKTIKAGIVTTSSNPYKSLSPHMFYNLNKTDYNVTKAKIINPLKGSHTDDAQSLASYWSVDFDTVTHTELAQFDVLVWAPDTVSFDVAAAARNYLPKINYFVETIGGTMIFDTSNTALIKGLGITTTAAVDSRTGNPSGPPFNGVDTATAYYDDTPNYVVGSSLVATDIDGESVFNGAAAYGGIDFDNDDFDTVSPYKHSVVTGMVGYQRLQYILSKPSDYRNIITGTNNASATGQPVLIGKTFPSGGNIYFSTMGITSTVNTIFNTSGRVVTSNTGDTVAYRNFFGQYSYNYNDLVGGLLVNGAMKMMLNMMYMSTRLKALDDADETVFSTSLVTYTDWFPSWTINASNDVLNQQEKQKYNFILTTTAPDSSLPVWQRTLATQNLRQLIDDRLTDAQKQRVAGATRKYTLYVTNPEVKVMSSDYLVDSTLPRAWTLAYSPKFVVPDDFGPHVIREEETKGEFEQGGQYTFKTYPPKPFTIQAGSSHVVSSQHGKNVIVDVTVQGSATQTIEIPPTIITPGTIGVAGIPTQIIDIDLYWSKHGAGTFSNSPYPFQSGAPHANGITNWQEGNYYAENGYSVNLNWPYWGANVILSQARGSSGEWVRFVQDALNRFYFFHNITGYIPPGGKALKIDGHYGSATHWAVMTFQQLVGARWVDGVVDAETWSLIGWMIIKLRAEVGYDSTPSHLGGYFQYYDWPEWYMQMHRFSDYDITTAFAKRSWVTAGSSRNKAPIRIVDAFQIEFDREYEIYGVTMIPFLFDSNARTQIWDWLHVGAARNMTTIDPSTLQPGFDIQRIVEADVPNRVNIFPIIGKTVSFGIAQDQPAGPGHSRIMGIRDMIVHARQTIPGTVGIPPTPPVYSQGTHEVKTVTFTYTQTGVVIPTGHRVYITPQVTWEGEGTLSDIRWTDIALSSSTINVSDLVVEFTSVGSTANPAVPGWYNSVTNWILPQFNIRHYTVANDVSGENFTYGPKIGFGGTAQYYTMSSDGRVDPYLRTDGFISKQEGVRLICDERGNPYGLPAMPSNWSMGNNTNAHFTKFMLNTAGTDALVYVGFYDKNLKEFITSDAGAKEISYYEYITRGPQNIYLAVLSQYEITESAAIPFAQDTVLLPYRWAMPVYGVTTTSRSKIQIEPLPSDLSVTQIWPLPIRTGSYSRPVRVRPRSEGALTTFLKDYQGDTITAYYSVVEASKGPWSDLYGRPYIDIHDEHPLIIDDNVIQLRQAPVLLIQEPTGSQLTLANPWRPVITIWKRASLLDEWVEVPLANVTDYNVRTGMFYLSEDLYSNDPNLVKVSYTTSRSVYNFKSDGTNRINLNPYINNQPDWLNEPLYIYILPEFCTTSSGVVIQDSVRTRTLYLTRDKAIFDPLQANYDPVAVLLGVVYITSSFDLNDLIILDTRRRGGGASSNLDEEELVRMVQEASSYWDVNHNHTTTYQKGGFVIIRLPAELKNDLDEAAIVAAIERNITAGVRYQIEDLEGNRW